MGKQCWNCGSKIQNEGRSQVIILNSLEVGVFFFSRNHCQQNIEGQTIPSHFTSITFYLPMVVEPRPGLEDGLVSCKKDLIKVFYTDQTQILNPDPDFQA